MLFGSGAMQEAHRRWFERDCPNDVIYRNVSDDWHGIALSGPKSRDLLARITRDDVGSQALRFRDLRQSFVAGVPVIMNRISFSGELGYEIYCRPHFLLCLATAIERAGADLGYRWYGARALMSMRLEKGWGAWGLEFRPDFTAIESGLDAFIDWDRDFVGRQPSFAARAIGVERRLVTMTIAVDGIDVSNDEAILRDGVAVGYVTSGGYAHRIGKSMAMGYVSSGCAAPGTMLDVEILGELHEATVLGGPAYDANGAHMRA